MNPPDLSRRSALIAGGASLALPGLASAYGSTSKRLVVILLRGAMDGLGAVPAFGDPDFERARAGLAPPPPGSAGGSLDLDGFFGLAPQLKGVHDRYRQGEVVVFHAISSPYRDRSHFDGQNLIEIGADRPFALQDGWGNRALLGLPDALKAGRRSVGVALAPATPLMMRGPAPVTSWSPSVLPAPNADLLQRLRALYQESDPKLLGALDAAAAAEAAAAGAAGADPFAALMGAAARLIKADDGPCLAMADLSGWDTHANQIGPYGVLPRNLSSLDRGLAALAEGLGPRWRDTAVLIMTEFGRTVAMNGTRGTDHGTGAAAVLLGGAVKGGRVLADWPGLKAASLYAGRDLRPTTDLRSVIKAVLRDHLSIDAAYLDRVVFPNSAKAPPLEGLLKSAASA